MDHFADRLLDAIEAKGAPVCVGLDPSMEKLPPELKHLPPGDAIERFCAGVIDAVAGIVPAVKPQIAYFERYGHGGVAAYERVCRLAAQAGLVVIGDVKRGDIGSTAAEYAAAHLGNTAADAVTVNSYFGADGITPFVQAALPAGKGLFVLVRTSNPSAAAIQDLTDAVGKPLYEHVAAQVAQIGESCVGQRGYSAVGAVVGATWPQQARTLREIMPQHIFLVPGYGAQGATAADCAAAFKSDGTGAIVNASRSVIYAFAGQSDWKTAIAQAAKAFAQDIRAALK